MQWYTSARRMNLICHVNAAGREFEWLEPTTLSWLTATHPPSPLQLHFNTKISYRVNTPWSALMRGHSIKLYDTNICPNFRNRNHW